MTPFLSGNSAAKPFLPLLRCNDLYYTNAKRDRESILAWLKRISQVGL